MISCWTDVSLIQILYFIPISTKINNSQIGTPEPFKIQNHIDTFIDEQPKNRLKYKII